MCLVYQVKTSCFFSTHHLYESLKRSSQKNEKIKNLDKLWQILNDIRESGERDFSLAEIGRRLEKVGGLKTQSLRNKQGKYFRDLIHVYANGVNGSTKYIPKNRSTVDEAISLINDPSVRGVIRTALDDAKRLKVTNDNLHAAFKNIQVGSDINSNNKKLVSEGIVESDHNGSLSLQLIQALKKGINEKRLAQQGMCIEKNGSITNEHGDTIFPPSFVFAIRKILEQ